MKVRKDADRELTEKAIDEAIEKWLAAGTIKIVGYENGEPIYKFVE